ncbi:4'-phosphopantetheinyl transferase family protein [Legionella oakridgensis]|uniref:4'-phosphopantetheinyl transferase family protein n=1 Tax=Legionella oakridgensis TaxID=29423 RepID=UPI0003DDF5F3|nr:4'-phosphopantetheinyl transferase superfamily protein [Legionella oakridgensis]ETO93621.1 phosphopantetheinyl transferase [Legionella oakridgensis RV-2-2007]
MPSFKALPLQDCSLHEERVDIWQFSLHMEFNNSKSLLSSDEQKRAERYYFARHRRRFTIARTMLRLILARYLNLAPEQLEFTYSSHGKPALPNHHLQFNMSHSQETALLAVGKNHSLGIDLEFFSARPYEGIADHLFSVQENQALHALPPMLKPLGFFHIWAQKEALIKACGLGLSYPTKQISLPILPTEAQAIYDPLHQQHWRVLSFIPKIASCAALCYNPCIQEIRYLTLNEVSALQP